MGINENGQVGSTVLTMSDSVVENVNGLTRQISFIVFDTNVFGRSATPNVSQIEKYAEACNRHEVTLLIPESVVWELAEHTMAATEDVLTILQKHNRDRDKWKVPRIEAPDPLTLEGIQRSIEEAGATVVKLTGNDAIEAIKDQVLQLGAGTKKAGTKTGASDSAAIRSIVSSYGSVLDSVLIVSGDLGAVESTCERLEVSRPQVVKHLGEIGSLFDEITEADADLTGQYFGAMEGLVGRDEILAELPSELITDLSREILMLPEGARLADHYWDFGNDAEFMATSILPLGSPVLFDNWLKTATSNVSIEGWLYQSLVRQDFLGNEPEFATYNIQVRVDLKVEVGCDGTEVSSELWNVSYLGAVFEPTSADVIYG